jgi:hypothetical protein
MSNKKAFHPEGLLSFYIVTYITLQTSHQECFFVRFVCFIIVMLRKNRVPAVSFQIFILDF